jgi:hypothetical protein
MNDEKDSIKKEEVIPSNYMIKLLGRPPKVFLLNVEPGVYAAVGAVGKTRRARYFTYFPEDMIKKTIIRVEPNSFYYLGTFSFETGSDTSDRKPDETQKYYYSNTLLGNHREIAGKQFIRWDDGLLFFNKYRDPQYIPLVMKESHNSKSDEIEFLKNNLGVFKGAGWDAKIQNRLNKIDELEKHGEKALR